MPYTLSPSARSFLVLLLIALGALLAAPAARAKEIGAPPVVLTVTSTLDMNDSNPGDGRCDALPLGGDQCTLRAALQESAALSGRERIVLGAGTYRPSPGKGAFVVQGCATIEGAGNDKSIIDGLVNDSKVPSNLLTIEATPACTEGVTISDLTVQNAGQGGVVINAGADVTLRRVRVRLNERVSLGFGAGIANAGELLLVDSTVEQNTNTARAGGIANSEGASLHILRSTISENRSLNQHGGGIINNGSLVIEQSTLSGNQAAMRGGALLNTGEALLISSTVAGNEANVGGKELEQGLGGGVINTDTGVIRLLNSIVAGNTNNREASHVAPDCAGTIQSLGYNLIGSRGSAGSCTISYPLQPNTTPATDRIGSLQAPLDPRLGALSDNGGPTRTMLPATDSPAIDAGALVPGSCGIADQRGRQRPFDGNADGVFRCDIGAVERVNPTPLSLSPSSVQAGPQPDLLIEVTGQGFSAATTILWNGSALATEFVSSTKLRATVPSARLMAEGTASVRASEADWQSHALTFTITAPKIAAPPKLAQTIDFAPLPDRQIGDPAFSPVATASSGLPVSFAVSGVCDLKAGEVTLVDVAGVCTVIASQDGNDTYAAADPVSRSFLITDPTKQTQTISFAPLADRLLAEGGFTLVASASSGLPVSFSAAGACSVSGSALELEGEGICMVVASQAGDATFNPAADVVRSFAISDGMRLHLPLLSR